MNPHHVVQIDGVGTPIVGHGAARAGPRPDDPAAAGITARLERTHLHPARVDVFIAGSVGSARRSAWTVGLDETTGRDATASGIKRAVEDAVGSSSGRRS